MVKDIPDYRMLVCFFSERASRTGPAAPFETERIHFEDDISVQLAASIMLNLLSSNCVETITKPKIRVNLIDDVILRIVQYNII